MRDESNSTGPLTGIVCTSDLTFQSPVNWTAVGFFLLLGTMHLGFAAASVAKGRWGGLMSFGFAAAFIAIAVIASRYRERLTFSPLRRVLRICNGVGPFHVEREIPFEAFHAVQLTLGPNGSGVDARIELVGDTCIVECPPTTIPRQQALFLAMLLDVPLIKAIEGDHGGPLGAPAGMPCDAASPPHQPATNSRYFA